MRVPQLGRLKLAIFLINHLVGACFLPPVVRGRSGAAVSPTRTCAVSLACFCLPYPPIPSTAWLPIQTLLGIPRWPARHSHHASTSLCTMWPRQPLLVLALLLATAPLRAMNESTPSNSVPLAATGQCDAPGGTCSEEGVGPAADSEEGVGPAGGAANTGKHVALPLVAVPLATTQQGYARHFDLRLSPCPCLPCTPPRTLPSNGFCQG